MDIFEQNIIGCESVKKTLRKISDALRRSDEYRSKGVALPHGLLLTGPPGTGKSTLLQCLAKDSGLNSILFRKSSEGNSFLKEMNKAFQDAKRAKPSIIILEDIHLYTTNRYGAEWSALQANIDDCKDKDVFIAATANADDYIAESLLRPGRFDYVLSLDIPRGALAEKIVARYLRGKNLSDDVNLTDIVRVLDGYSCATLETAINIASLNAIYDHADTIERRHLTSALMEVIYKASDTDEILTPEERRSIAVHEAAHAVVSEILTPGSVSVTSILSSNQTAGITDYYRHGYSNEDELMNIITVSLAGKAGVEILLGKFDISTECDIEKAYRYMALWVHSYAGGGFSSVESRQNGISQAGMYQHEQLISARLETLYERAKKIVYANHSFIEQVSDELIKKKILLNSDIQKIGRLQNGTE